MLCNTMITNEICPQCKRDVNSSRVRLVLDSCGHRKCRECLLNEEAGCLLCSNNYTPVYSELKPVQDTPSSRSNDDPPGISSALDDVPQHLSNLDVDNTSHYQPQPPSDSAEVSSVFPTVSEESQRDSPVSPRTTKYVPSKMPPTFGLKEHIVFTPGNPPSYTCKRCKKTHYNRKAARYHNYCGAPDKEKPHTCKECGQGFVTKGHLSYHIKSHTGILPFVCQSCGKGFKQVSKLNRHSRSHQVAPEKPFKCSLCEKAFSSKQILNDHELSHEKDHCVICPICSKRLSSQSCLRKHKKLHSEPLHSCGECGKKFPVKWSLEVHMRSHQWERKLKCQMCPKTFKIQGDLKRHLLVHQNIGEWKCEECHVIFRRRDNLLRHMKNIHMESSFKESDEDVDASTSEEKNAGSPLTFVHPVSVIRPVSVIKKAESSSIATSHSDSNSEAEYNYYLRQKTSSKSGDDGKDQSSSFTSKSDTELAQCLDQKFHRKSVVQYSSSSVENVYDSNNSRNEESERDVPHEISTPEEGADNVPRPRVIVNAYKLDCDIKNLEL